MKKIDFNCDWTFYKIEEPAEKKKVTLPHDAMLREARRADAASGSGGAYFEGGSYVYEKSFPRPAAEHVLIQFEGVYKNAKVTPNGKEAGGAAYYNEYLQIAKDFTDRINAITGKSYTLKKDIDESSTKV